MNVTEQRFVTVEELAGMIPCTRRTVYNLIDSGRIPAPIKLGRMVRWPVSEIDRWISAGCPDATDWEQAKAGDSE